MEKEYKLPEENTSNKVNELAIKYGTDIEMTFSPPLTEEELADSITTEELLEDITQYIHELFSKK